MHQNALVEAQATAFLKSNILVFCGSYPANSCRTDVRSQFKASSMQPASSAYKLRVQIRYNPLPLFCSGLKKLSEINLIHVNVPKRNARFSWQMHKISCCHRIPQCLLSTRCQRMQICSWVWCSFVLQILSFTAVVFCFHVHRAKFSEAGDRPWLPMLMWIYMFLYLPEKRLFELNSVFVRAYLRTLTHQYWKQPCSSFKHYLFSTSPLELELSFQIPVWRYRIGFSSLLRTPGHRGNNNHNHSNTKQKTCNHEELQSSSVTWGGPLPHPLILCAPQERKL